MDATRRPHPSTPALRGSGLGLPVSGCLARSPCFLSGAPLLHQDGAAGAGGRNSARLGPSRLGWGGGTRGNSEGPGAAVPRPQAAACPPVSPLLLHPLSGPGPPRMTSAAGILQCLLPPSAGRRGWLETRGQAGHLAPPWDLASPVQSGSRREAVWGWAEACWDQPGPRPPSQGVCVLHSAKHKLCGVQPHCPVTGAFLTVTGGHLCPERLGE